MLVLLIVVGWLSGAAFAVLTMNLVAGLNAHRDRLEVARRVAEAARPLPETLVARPPAGPAQDALRSAQLRLMLDKTEPRA